MTGTSSRPLKITLIFIAAASLWVLCSDWVLWKFSDDLFTLTLWQTGKAWLTISVMALLLYRLLRWHEQLHADLARQIQECERQTQRIQLHQSAERLKQLSRRLLSVQEEERRALARELHDEFGQQLTALKLNLGNLKNGLTNAANQRRLTDCLEIVDHTLARIRDTARDLRPSVLDDLGLASALHWYARRQAERSGCTIEVRDHLPSLPAEVETAVFRIVQEAVNNALRHGRASYIAVDVAADDQQLTLAIQDNGNGFDPEMLLNRSMMGLGLISMRERAELLGGCFALHSLPGAGVVVKVAIPCAVEVVDE